jgi:hypothetical protein
MTTEPEDKKLTVMIATPMYGGMCTGTYTESLLNNMSFLSQQNIKIYWANLFNESLITRARNELTRSFLASDADYLVFVDADIGFPHDGIAQLLLADKDVTCGIYPKKSIAWDRVAAAGLRGDEDPESYAGSFVFNMVPGSHESRTNEDGLIEVRHGGTGFMAIKRGVFEHLAEHVPTYRTSSLRDADGEYIKPLTYEFFATSIDASGALLSEDYHFCELVRKHGGEVYANPFIKLSHTGTHIFTGDILKSGANLS